MSCSRSLLVDTLPIHKQQTGAAWGKCTPDPEHHIRCLISNRPQQAA